MLVPPPLPAFPSRQRRCSHRSRHSAQLAHARTQSWPERERRRFLVASSSDAAAPLAGETAEQASERVVALMAVSQLVEPVGGGGGGAGTEHLRNVGIGSAILSLLYRCGRRHFRCSGSLRRGWRCRCRPFPHNKIHRERLRATCR